MKSALVFMTLVLFGLDLQAQQMQVFSQGPVSRGFIENKGQVRDQNNLPNSDVLYVLSQGAFNLQLKKSGFSYELFTVVKEKEMDEAGFMVDDDSREENSTRLASAHRVDVEFSGVSKNVSVVPSLPHAFHYNYYFAPVESKRIEAVNSFGTVTYVNLYPNIDMVVSAGGPDGNSDLKYEFIIHPGGNPSAIRMKYHGASSMAAGDDFLTVNCVNGFVKESAPVCFLQGSEVEVYGSVLLSGNETSFQIGAYDRSQTLVIDPSIIWGTYYGGESTEDVAEISLDYDNKPSIGGNTLSTSSIATSGAYQTSFAGGFHDFFIAKFNASAGLEWGTYLGGTGRDLGFGISTDNNNDLYFNGKTTSDGLATSGAHQSIRGGNDDALIAKFNTNSGALDWCSYLGGTGNDQYRAFIFDADNNFFVCGYTESPNAIATPGAYQEVYAGEGDCFITKWSPDGEVLWSTYHGAAGQDRYHSINMNDDGDLYVTGTTSSTSGLATAGVYQTVYGGGDAELMLGKFTAAGDLIWCTYYGGEGHDRGRGVETDASGYVYVSGFTNSTTGISTPGALQTEWSEGYDSQTSEPLDDNLLFKISADGTTRYWGTYYGGPEKEELWGMNMDRKQNCLYVVGSTQSETNIAYGNGWQPVKGKGSDALFARWTFDGQITYGSYFGKDKGEQFEDVEIDLNSDIYLVGKTEENQLPASYGAYQTFSNGGDYEGVLYKFYGGVACKDLLEPNNTFSSAHVLYARASTDSLVYGYDGNLKGSTDKDYFKFTVSAGFKHHFVELTGLSHNYNLKIFTSSQVLKGISNNTGLTSDTIVANNLPLGDYYIQITAGTPAEYDTLKCYHINLVKSSTRFQNDYNGSKLYYEIDESAIRLSPNPASSDVKLELELLKAASYTIHVSDQMGRIVFSRDVSFEEGLQEVQLPMSHLPSGIYHVALKSEDISWTGMIVKQ